MNWRNKIWMGLFSFALLTQVAIADDTPANPDKPQPDFQNGIKWDGMPVPKQDLVPEDRAPKSVPSDQNQPQVQPQVQPHVEEGANIQGGHLDSEKPAVNKD